MTRRSILTAGLAGAAIIPPDARALMTGPDRAITRNVTPGPTPIRLAHNIKREGTESPEEMIRRKHDEGFRAIKGARHPGGNKGEPWHSMTMAEREEIVKACQKYDMVIYEVGGYTNLISPDTVRREANIKALVYCMEVAESVNCRMVGTVAGSCDPNNLINVHPDNWTLKTWKVLVASVKQALKDTAGMKVAIGMEAQVTSPIDCPLAHKRLMEDVGDDRLVVNLDPINMMTPELYYHTTELIEECFDLLGERIYGCHAKDTFIWPDTQTVHVQEVCPGKGVLDYETYLARISRLEWPRALEPEHITDEEYSEAFAYIREVAGRVGVNIHG